MCRREKSGKGACTGYAQRFLLLRYPRIYSASRARISSGVSPSARRRLLSAIFALRFSDASPPCRALSHAVRISASHICAFLNGRSSLLRNPDVAVFYFGYEVGVVQWRVVSNHRHVASIFASASRIQDLFVHTWSGFQHSPPMALPVTRTNTISSCQYPAGHVKCNCRI